MSTRVRFLRKKGRFLNQIEWSETIVAEADMTEKEKMLAGGPYDCGEEELMALWVRGKNLMREFNSLDYGDRKGQARLLDEMLGSRGENTQVTAPFYVDYGAFIHLGENCEINMNCVFLDCNIITVGRNVLIGPGVHIYAVSHPLEAKERIRPPHTPGAFPFAVGLT
ncbi:hypothetical protein LJC09_04950, partial [Desulfovibrio sp. OttesenSCG-928-F20]|nr:hypothetical protein [Desulfovibrio sp. OttesenSCG-928-F20]